MLKIYLGKTTKKKLKMSELHRTKGMGPRVDINNDNNDDQMSNHPSRVNESPNHNKKVHVDGAKNNSQQFHQFRDKKVLKYSGSKSTPVLEKVFKIPSSKVVAPAPADLLYKKDKDKVLKGTTPGQFSMPERIQA